MSQCAKCQRTIVQGLTDFIDSFDFFYGPDDKKSHWPRQEIRIGRVVGFSPVPPNDASVYGGKCSQCGKTYCVICMKQVSLNRLIKASTVSRVAGMTSLLNERGELWCPECNTTTRTVKAW